MPMQFINAEGAPKAVGTYSHAVRFGNTVYLSGQLGIAPDSGELLNGFVEQTHQMFRNLRAVCRSAGGELSDIARLGVYLTDMAMFAEFNRIMAEYFTAPYPARSAIQVAALPRGGLVEADAVMIVEKI